MKNKYFKLSIAALVAFTMGGTAIAATLAPKSISDTAMMQASPVVQKSQYKNDRKLYGQSYGRGLPRHCQRVYDRMLENEFETLLYIASYRDLVRAFGKDVEKARDHFARHGCREGRRISFDPIQYIAGYDDLVRAFGGDERRGLDHYFSNGYRERRKADNFCGRGYARAYPDVRRALGNNEYELARHYIRFGFREGRGRKRNQFQIVC